MSHNDLQIEYASVSGLLSNPNAARRHSRKKIADLAESIQRLGFNVPLIVGPNDTVLAGHARLAAARMVGMDEVPVIRVSHLSEVECRAFMLADNKFALNAFWDAEVLAVELNELIDGGFDVTMTGFSVAEAELTICSAEEAKSVRTAAARSENAIPNVTAISVTERGDLWLLGRHKLVCGDARESADYELLLGGEPAQIMFTDPPYNVRIAGNVSGLGKVTHEDFAMASGEMSRADFTNSLSFGRLSGLSR